jgi:hypothetical protein
MNALAFNVKCCTLTIVDNAAVLTMTVTICSKEYGKRAAERYFGLLPTVTADGTKLLPLGEIFKRKIEQKDNILCGIFIMFMIVDG